MNQIINMVLRQVIRRLVSMGVDKGFDAAAKRRGRAELTPEQARAAAENKKRAKQAMRVTRRLGR